MFDEAKLIYLVMDFEIFNKLPEFKHSKEYSGPLQTFTIKLFAKRVSNVNSMLLIILPKGSISGA